MNLKPLKFLSLNDADWTKLGQHLVASLFAVVGEVLSSYQDGDLWLQLRHPLLIWLGLFLLYTAGFLQDGSK